MKKNLLKTIVVLGATIFTLIANAAAASACYVGLYQPEVPKSLREE